MEQEKTILGREKKEEKEYVKLVEKFIPKLFKYIQRPETEADIFLAEEAAREICSNSIREDALSEAGMYFTAVKKYTEEKKNKDLNELKKRYKNNRINQLRIIIEFYKNVLENHMNDDLTNASIAAVMLVNLYRDLQKDFAVSRIKQKIDKDKTNPDSEVLKAIQKEINFQYADPEEMAKIKFCTMPRREAGYLNEKRDANAYERIKYNEYMKVRNPRLKFKLSTGDICAFSNCMINDEQSKKVKEKKNKIAEINETYNPSWDKSFVLDIFRDDYEVKYMGKIDEFEIYTARKDELFIPLVLPSEGPVSWEIYSSSYFKDTALEIYSQRKSKFKNLKANNMKASKKHKKIKGKILPPVVLNKISELINRICRAEKEYMNSSLDELINVIEGIKPENFSVVMQKDIETLAEGKKTLDINDLINIIGSAVFGTLETKMIIIAVMLHSIESELEDGYYDLAEIEADNGSMSLDELKGLCSMDIRADMLYRNRIVNKNSRTHAELKSLIHTVGLELKEILIEVNNDELRKYTEYLTEELENKGYKFDRDLMEDFYIIEQEDGWVLKHPLIEIEKAISESSIKDNDGLFEEIEKDCSEAVKKKKYKYIDSYKELNAIAESKGFTLIRANGDHGIFENADGKVAVIPQGRSIGKGLSIMIQKTLDI